MIILCIVSASNGRGEDLEVILSVVSVVEHHDKSTAKDMFTHTPIRQYSYEFIVDGRYETTTVKNGWKERPVGPRRRISMFTSSPAYLITDAPIKSLQPMLCAPG